MSHGARSLFVALTARFGRKIHNNGRLYLSVRAAAHELGSNKDAVARWYRELQHYGFIVMTEAGCLGVEGKGKAPHWRVTDLGYMHDPPTRDFLQWNGKRFRDAKVKKEKPVPESGDRPSPKVGTLPYPKVGTLHLVAVPESGDIQQGGPVPESGDISRSTIYSAKKQRAVGC
jgi:hypothetical protein